MLDFVTVVSGMPRSGTSLMMRMLEAGGVPALTDGIRPADEQNPHGYFEYEPVKRLQYDAEWFCNVRGRSLKVIYRLLPHLPATVPCRILFMERDLREVFASQSVMLQARGDPAMSQSESLVLPALSRELQQARETLRSHKWLPVPYLELIEKPVPLVSRINDFLGGELDQAAMLAAIDTGLYRNRFTNPR